ncbi:MAG: hypothetical protein HYW28_04215 [Rhodospirillales bacterium]|nr:hypothetical protein [Rhodospirillales bacterium]MBI2585065.1 hypothetical protein [Rhodospirillales bacterium]MBI2978662.1 hypothetical protein [Rhodospirillales bacterium]
MAPHRQSDRAFGLTFAALFTAIAGVGWLAFDARLAWALWVAAAFLAVALAAPWLLLPLNRLWGVVAARLGGVANFVLLASFFYLFVLPLGLILRLTGRDPLPRGTDPQAKTYWTPVGRHTDEETLKDMF